MRRRRTSGYITILLIVINSLGARAQESDTVRTALRDIEQALVKPKANLVSGVSVRADLLGLFMYAAGSRFSNMECGAKLSFRDKYFPLVELGIGRGKREGQDNDNAFETTAPFFRVGMDYNFGKPTSMNRILGGVRYGWSVFNYDFTCPTFTDPVWGTTKPLALESQDGSAHWLEFVVGLQTKLVSFLHLGWDIRFKARMKQKTSDYGQPWYIPGYGRNSGTMWGGTVNLVFDIETKWTKKDKHKTASK